MRYKGAAFCGTCVTTAPLPTSVPCSDRQTDNQPDQQRGWWWVGEGGCGEWVGGERGKREEERQEGKGWRGFAFAVQLHREVRPESGLVGIVEHIEVNKR